jgi:hypothetical protein
VTNIQHYADKTCFFCQGTGEVLVRREATGRVMAVCSCVKSVHRALTVDAMERARALRRSGLAR